MLFIQFRGLFIYFNYSVMMYMKRLSLTLQNGRVAKLLTVGVRQAGDKRPNSFSRCFALARYEASKISSDSFAIMKSLNVAGSHQEAW